MEFINIKGSNDFLPEEQLLKNKIIDTLKNVFETYSYLPIETATLCSYELLASKYAGGAEILKEIYTLKDQGNRNIGLRYDLTVPFSKVIALNLNKKISLPFRRYEIGKVYRDGPVKVGRDREFYQCDADLCGIKGSYPEVEILSMACSIYKKLNIDIEIQWNNRKLLTGLIILSGINKEDVTRVILSVDKLAKIGEDGVRRELDNIDSSSLNKLFEYFKCDIDKLQNIKTDEVNFNEGLSETKELNDYIQKLGLNECIFTPYLARGLEIYTSTIWEVFDKKKRLTCSIGGGGRYDKIITNFINDGNEYPAVGMTFGLVPIYEILSMEKKENTIYDLFIIPMNTKIESLNLANKLREKGIRVMLEMNDRKVKKSLDWANKNNVNYVIVLGEDELTTNKLKLKDMKNSIEFEFSIDDIDLIASKIMK